MTTHSEPKNIEVPADVRAAWETHPDPILHDLAHYAPALSLDVTILTPGATIIGTTMSYNEFCEANSASMTDGLRSAKWERESDELTDAEKEEFEVGMPRTIFREQEAPQSEEEILNEKPARFLHLKNVIIIGNGFTSSAPLRAPHIRLPFSKVTGWFVGRRSDFNEG